MYQECRHIKTSGTKCGAPALKGKAYCYFHFRAHQLRHRGTTDRMEAFMNPKFKVALLEDRGAIQAALSETIHALAQDHMDHKRAGKILYGLHLAIICAKVPGEIVAIEPVRDIFQNEEGEEIGPEQIGYDEDDELPEDEKDEIPENKGDELAKDEAGNLAKDETHELPESAIGKAEDSNIQKEDIDREDKVQNGKDRVGNGDGEDQDLGLTNSKANHHESDRPRERQSGTANQKAIPKTPISLRQTITNYIADLKQNHPELAAHALIRRMEKGVSSIP